MRRTRTLSGPVSAGLAVFLGLAGLAGLLLAGCPEAASPADATAVPPSSRDRITLVETPPVETTIDHADIVNAADVWVEMIDHARKSVDFAEFYASDVDPKDGAARSELTPVVRSIEQAVARGVHVRFLADSVFAPKYPDTLARLKSAGVDVRIIDFSQRGGGVHHAKYFLVDDEQAFIGSQNFDWRSLAHIQEMGVRVESPTLALALLDVYDTDWELASGRGLPIARVRRHPPTPITTDAFETVTLVASPRGWLPDEGSWELPRLVALLDGAKQAVELQVLTYKTKERDGTPFPTLDDALRRAAARGVHVSVLVSDWSSKPGSDGRAALDALAALPNVTVRVITIPKWSGGDIPYARVAHAKYLVIDAGAQAWVGSSNWEGDYFTKTRNVGVLVSGGKLAPRLHGVFADGWTSAYARPLAEVTPAVAAPPSSSGPARP